MDLCAKFTFLKEGMALSKTLPRWITLTDVFVVEYLGVTTVGVLSPKLPNVKERLPVNVTAEAAQIEVSEDSDTELVGLNWTKRMGEKRRHVTKTFHIAKCYSRLNGHKYTKHVQTHKHNK